MMQIIEYEDQYKEQVIRLILTIQNQEAKIGLSLEEQPDLNNIESAYLKQDGGFWIALNEEDQVVGTIGILNKGNGYGVLKKFFVRADCRSQKVGYRLYHTLLEFCRVKKIKTVLLDTPSVAVVSHRFYERNGFSRITKEELPIPYEFPDRDSYLYMKYETV